MTTKDEYLAKAAASRAEADAASLENVKERCHRSEAAWNEMAAGAERAEKLRARREAENQAKADAAKAAAAQHALVSSPSD